MTIHEKLDRLTRLHSRQAVSKAAGLYKGALTAILSRKSPISTQAAVGLARAMSVDVAWLIDDSKGWPPVRIEEPEACSAA